MTAIAAAAKKGPVSSPGAGATPAAVAAPSQGAPSKAALRGRSLVEQDAALAPPPMPVGPAERAAYAATRPKSDHRMASFDYAQGDATSIGVTLSAPPTTKAGPVAAPTTTEAWVGADAKADVSNDAELARRRRSHTAKASSSAALEIGDDTIGVKRSETQTRGFTHANGRGGGRASTTSAGLTVKMDADGTPAETTMSLGGSRSAAVHDASGEAEAETSKGASGELTVVSSEEDGDGVRLGVSGEASRSKDEQLGDNPSGGVSGGAKLTLTDKTKGIEGNAGVERTLGPMSASFNLKAGASVHVTSTPVPNTDPKQYVVETTTTWVAGGDVGLGATKEASEDAPGGAFGSLGVKAAGSRTRTQVVRHVMPVADVKRYFEDASAAARGVADAHAPKELGFAAALQKAAANAPPTAAALDSADAARAMRDGDSISDEVATEASVSAEASGGAGAFAGGASVGAGSKETVKRQVVRTTDDGHAVVEVHLTFGASRSRTLSGNASAHGVGGQASVGTERGGDDEVVVRLTPDAPDFRARFDEAMAIRSRASAVALAERTGAERIERASASKTTAGGVGLMRKGAVALGVTGSTTASSSSEVHFGPLRNGQRALSGTTTGARKDERSLSALGLRLATTSTSTTATNDVASDGSQQVDVATTQVEGIPLPAWLQKQWRTTRESLQSIQLDDGDLMQLAGRAANAHAWFYYLTPSTELAMRKSGAWSGLRPEVHAPHPPEAWKKADAKVAEKLARGKAITDFVATSGEDGHRALVQTARGDAANPLGTLAEFPDALRTLRAPYAQLTQRVKGFADELAAITGPMRIALATNARTEVLRLLNMTRRAITACDGFSNPSVKVEMLGTLDRQLRDVERAYQAALGAGTTPAPSAAAAGAAAPPPSASASTELTAATTTIQRYRDAEQTHLRWGAMHVTAGVHAGGSAAGDEFAAAENELQTIADDWRGRWGQAAKQAAAARARLGAPAAGSADKPDLDKRVMLLRAVRAANPWADAARIDGVIARWRREHETG